MFELRDKTIQVKSGTFYPDSSWESKPIIYMGEEVEAIVVIRGLVYTTRARGNSKQEPYAYTSTDPNSGLGLWLNETEYEVLPAADEENPPPSV